MNKPSFFWRPDSTPPVSTTFTSPVLKRYHARVPLPSRRSIIHCPLFVVLNMPLSSLRLRGIFVRDCPASYNENNWHRDGFELLPLDTRHGLLHYA